MIRFWTIGQFFDIQCGGQDMGSPWGPPQTKQFWKFLFFILYFFSIGKGQRTSDLHIKVKSSAKSANLGLLSPLLWFYSGLSDSFLIEISSSKIDQTFINSLKSINSHFSVHFRCSSTVPNERKMKKWKESFFSKLLGPGLAPGVPHNSAPRPNIKKLSDSPE